MSLLKRIRKSVTGASHNSENKSSVIGGNNNDPYKTFDPKRPAPEISEREVEILKECWKIIQQDIANVGIITFVG